MGLSGGVSLVRPVHCVASFKVICEVKMFYLIQLYSNGLHVILLPYAEHVFVLVSEHLCTWVFIC